MVLLRGLRGEPCTGREGRSAPTGDRRGRCGACDGCLADECGTCKWCLDQTKRGGPNTLRRPCIFRRCEQVYDDSKARFRAARGSAATAPAEETDEPGPGTRVWALFDDDSLCQSWWGGTIISISGVADEMRYDVVFDDGERQGVYAARCFHSPPDEQLPVSSPNAKAKAVLEKMLSEVRDGAAETACPEAAGGGAPSRRGRRCRPGTARSATSRSSPVRSNHSIAGIILCGTCSEPSRGTRPSRA